MPAGKIYQPLLGKPSAIGITVEHIADFLRLRSHKLGKGIPAIFIAFGPTVVDCIRFCQCLQTCLILIG